MMEFEKIERAKLYIDKLANGINPLDDTMVADGDIINDVRISRCFFFVSDILRQVIENGGVQGKEKSKKEPFKIPFEKRRMFDFSETPITASEVVQRINALSDGEKRQKLYQKGLVNWLFEIGTLTRETTTDGKKRTHPTAAGNETGILLETRTGENGSYQVVVYGLDAQRFIIDNLDALIKAENMDAELKNKPWTKEHEECLVELYQKGVPFSEIAVILKRKTSSVQSRLNKLGLESNN